MVQCFVPDCNQRSENTSYKFYRFPKDEREKKRWIDLIRFPKDEREKKRWIDLIRFPKDEREKKRWIDLIRFPKDEREKKRWIDLIRRQDREPRDADRVCSYHFVGGEKSAGPTIYKRNQKKRFDFSSPEKKSKRKRLVFADSQQQNEMTPPQTPLPNAEEFLNVTPVNSNPVFSKATMSIMMENLEEKIKSLTEELKYFKLTFSYEHIKGNDELIMLYTGLPNAAAFDCLYELCDKYEIKYYYEWKVEKIRKKDQLLLTLMKLRRNDPQLDLATRFSVSRGTVQNIIFTWIHVLYEILFLALMKNIPSREKNQGCLPACFATFCNCRITLDCTEVFCAIPQSSMAERNMTYSHYKHRNTMKGLVGVAPNGVVTFLSDLYPGSNSDKEIVRHSCVLDKMEAGDLVLADKGFLIYDLMPQGVSLNIPPFLNSAQFTKEQVTLTRRIARSRVHVERAIKRIKGFLILDFIPAKLRPYADIVWKVCGALTNLQFPLIREVENMYCPNTEDDM